MYKFICTVCGYIHEADKKPSNCPNCKSSCAKFDKMHFSIDWEKKYNFELYAQIRSTFISECMEVGIYLAMSRQADRDGYPEIAETFKNIALEEAEHAARFAEILGELITEDTKKNLETRTEAEYEATEGKLKIAKKAKECGLDTIHDILQVMCKEEVKHGKVFAGLLEKYFEDEN